MSKLIYSPSASRMEETYSGIKNLDKTVNPVYYSIAFTGDGFMYTHGQKFRLFKVVDNAAQGLTFSITNGTAEVQIDGTSMGSGTVVQSVTGDSIVTATTTNGAVTIAHATPLTAQQAGSYGNATNIPTITVNQSGHITAISNNSIDVTKVKASSTTASGTYYPVGVTNANTQNPKYQTKFYFNGSGDVYANNLYIGTTALSALFAPLSHTTEYATGSAYGHVKLYDSADSDKGADAHWAATPAAVAAAIATSNQYAEDLFASQDAMIFVGTVNAAGVIQAHNDTVAQNVTDGTTNFKTLPYKTGWTFRFTTAGTFEGQSVEVGDMIIAVNNKGNDFAIGDWTIIQANLDGTLSSTASNLTGVLYATGSRSISALAFDNGKVLTSTTNGIAFVNKNTLWRTIQVDSTSIGTNTLNLKSGTYVTLSNTNGAVTIDTNTADIIGTSSYLNIEQGQTKFQYKPNAEATLTIGSLLSLNVSDNAYTLSHATVGTAVSTAKLGKITTDAYGHVTSFTEVTTLPNPSSLTIKKGSTSMTYSGSAARTLVFADGTDVSLGVALNSSSNQLTVTPSITHKYRPISYKAPDAASATSLLANSSDGTFTLVSGTNVVLSREANDPAGQLTISAYDTWRDVLAYKIQNSTLTSSASSISTSNLAFSNDFLWSNNELGIMWTEIDDQGNVQYVK